MTTIPTGRPGEPPPQQRGLTREERGRDVSEAQAQAEAETSNWKQFPRVMSPQLVWSMADGYPVVFKQFIQFCLILIYPAWVFAVLVGGLSFGFRLLRDGLSAAVAALLADAGVPEGPPSRGVHREQGEVP